MKKRIGIDARLYFQTGVGTYLRNLILHLSRILTKDREVYLYVLEEDRPKIQVSDLFTLRPVRSGWHTLHEQVSFYVTLMRDDLDLMHFTYFSYPILYARPFVATIHDLTPLLFKTGRASTHAPIIYEIKHRVFTHILKSQVHNAQHIITPTQSVKEQILQIYGKVYSEKITPVHEGLSADLTDAARRASSSKLLPGLSPEYFLYVGNFYPHKNIERLIMAYKLLQVKNKPELILVGPDNQFSKGFKKQIESSGITGIRFLYDVPNDQLVSLYKHARALVNPSLSEGFGLPLIEASALKCPVIASDIPVFHEHLGKSYVAFDPTSVEDIVRALKTPPEMLPVAQVPDTCSFKTMAQETLKVYQNTLETV